MPRLVSLDVKVFPAEVMVRPDHVSAVEVMHDGDQGVVLRVHMLGGFTFLSYRFDGSDAAVLAKLRTVRDHLVDEIRLALNEDRPALPAPASPEKRSL